MSPKPPAEFHDLIQMCLNATTVEDIHHVCSLACDLFEFDQFMYGSRIPTSFVRPQLILISGYQQDWWDHYNKNNYIKIDPVIDYCTKNTLPVQWHQIDSKLMNSPKAKNLMRESASFGLASGISVPVHSPSGEFAMLSFASERAPESNEAHISRINSQIMMLAYHVHEASMRIFKSNNTSFNTLTKREKECLLWAAEGKTSDETSMIMHISESTVRFHLNNAAKKLNVHSKRHAIARAICLGVISPLL